LTQGQVGEIFGEIYGEHYSKASISRMIDYLRSGVQEWLNRPLEGYYPIVLVDAIHIKIHRKRSVATEAFYVVLGVKEDKKRGVLGIYNRPTESAAGWEDIFRDVQSRGAGHIGLLVSDGLTGLDSAPSVVYPKTLLQRCVTHLKRNMLSKVRHGDKMELAEDYAKCSVRARKTTPSAKPGKLDGTLPKMGKGLQEHQKDGGGYSYKYYFT